MAKLESDTSNGEEEKPNEFSSDKSEASEELMRGEGKKVLKNRR